MKEYTDITVFVDRSGSMSSIKSTMESAYDEFLMQHRQTPSTRLTLIQFNHVPPTPEIVYEDKPVADAGRLVLEPRGNTPLLDALCRAIDQTGTRLGALGSDCPDQILFIVITDGAENASREFRREDVRHRIQTQSVVYKWQFVFLGANQDMFAEAATFGVPMAAAVNFSPSVLRTRNVLGAMSANSARYAARMASNPHFSPEQRDAALDDHEKWKKEPSGTTPTVSPGK
jgi:hypothetical protein